jgi:hypothetical protein
LACTHPEMKYIHLIFHVASQKPRKCKLRRKKWLEMLNFWLWNSNTNCFRWYFKLKTCCLLLYFYIRPFSGLCIGPRMQSNHVPSNAFSLISELKSSKKLDFWHWYSNTNCFSWYFELKTCCLLLYFYIRPFSGPCIGPRMQ